MADRGFPGGPPTPKRGAKIYYLVTFCQKLHEMYRLSGIRHCRLFFHTYKARHAHKRLYTVLPKYSKIQVLPGITSCRLMKYNKQAIELNSLLLK